jgi:hypothetical protein
MPTRSESALLLDRPRVRFSNPGNFSQADSPLSVMSGMNKLCLTSRGSLGEKRSRLTSDPAAFLKLRFMELRETAGAWPSRKEEQRKEKRVPVETKIGTTLAPAPDRASISLEPLASFESETTPGSPDTREKSLDTVDRLEDVKRGE